MRKVIVSMVVTSLVLLFGAALFGQEKKQAQEQTAGPEQKPGQELVFPKDMAEHPSDVHLGSDPYLKKENKEYKGSDETGYPRDYDPNAQYEESTTTIKTEKKKKKHDSSEEQKE